MSNSKVVHIDKIDLENDFTQLTHNNKNPFPVDVFPKITQEIIYEGNDKYQFALDYLGAGILTAVSSAIGNSLKVNVKNGWNEKANLFTVIVGRPGDSKSHALNFCLKPIQIKENLLFDEYSKLLKEYEEELNNVFKEYRELYDEQIDMENINVVRNSIKKKKNKLKRIIKLSKYLIDYEYDYLKDSLVILEKIS